MRLTGELMARRRDLDVCIFCAPDPCTCGVIAPPKAAPAKRVRKAAATVDTPPAAPVAEPEPDAVPDPEPTPQPRRSSGARAAMRSHSAKPPVVVRPPVLVAAPQKVQVAPPREERDHVMDEAIRACAVIMDPMEKRIHQAVLESTSPVAERAAAWREKRRIT